MKDNYTIDDFKKGVRNPFFHKINRKTEIFVRHETYKIYEDIGKSHNVEAEIIMNRCLESYAQKLLEHE
jgi:hypothetical protein